MRTEPNSEADLVTFLDQGDEVYLMEEITPSDEGVWQLVEYKGLTGWVLVDDLDPQ
jgi:hypothetical protein